jgi:predicted dehydrogenase
MSLRIAVIGLGHMGKIHLNKLLTFHDVEISAVVDIDMACVKELSRDTGAKTCEDYREAIQSCDAAIIASPTETHYTIGKYFLEAGKHVFMEKPITVFPEDAQDLIRAADKRKLVFQIGHLERFNPAFFRALQFVQKPVLIEASRISPFTGRSIDIDVVLDLMIHDLDLVLSLVDEEDQQVSAQGICFMTDKLDAVSARIEFAGGCVASITASRISPKKERALTIYEHGKSISIDLLQGKCISIIKDSNGKVETAEYAAGKIDPVQDELSEFIDSIKRGKAPSVTGADGLKALILATKIKEYIAEKQRASNIQ